MTRALDKATKTWEVLEVLEPVNVASFITQEIPSWVQFLKLTGSVHHTNPTTDEPYMRFSFDGSTFKAGATDYSYSYLFQSGNTAQAIPITGAASARFMLLGNTVLLPQFEIIIDVGGVRGSRTVYPTWQSKSTGLPGGATLGVIIHNGYCGFVGPLRRISFNSAGTSQFLAGTKLLMEGI
jgi:hypothetical protein